MINEFISYMFKKSEDSFTDLLALIVLLVASIVVFVLILALIIVTAPWLFVPIVLGVLAYQVKGFIKHKREWDEEEHKIDIGKLMAKSHEYHY